GAMLAQVLFLRERLRFLEEQLCSMRHAAPTVTAAETVQQTASASASEPAPASPTLHAAPPVQEPVPPQPIPQAARPQPPPMDAIPAAPTQWQRMLAMGRDGFVSWIKRGNPL